MTQNASVMERVASSPLPGGLAGWLLARLRQGKAARAQRELRLVETLSLGGQKHIILVACGEERYLVGTGVNSVQSIVRVGAENPCP